MHVFFEAYLHPSNVKLSFSAVLGESATPPYSLAQADTPGIWLAIVKPAMHDKSNILTFMNIFFEC